MGIKISNKAFFFAVQTTQKNNIYFVNDPSWYG